MQAKRAAVFFAGLLSAAFPAFSQESGSRGIYISPNNDGVQDTLEFSLRIKDQRYVQAWAFTVENEHGETVRTIANKESRPEMETSSGIKGVAQSIWRMITRVKRGVAVPETFRWDGLTDSGSTAPDGKYFFYIIAEDDNGNTTVTEKIPFYIDNTPPEITAAPPQTPDGMIFSPDGDGNKDEFRVTQSGSAEDLWKITITDAAGLPVREENIRNTAPGDFAWDGKDNAGDIVPDGVYAYRIEAEDRAGNRASAEINNILVNTERPSIHVAIRARAFSPNGDGVQDTMRLIPSVPVQNGLQRWTLSVLGPEGNPVRVFSHETAGGTETPEAVEFDGRSADGVLLPEGIYRARLDAEYVNGHRPQAFSPDFELDVTAPEATVRASSDIFSPVGDGRLDTVTFTQSVSAENAWTAGIFPAEGGDAVRTIRFGSRVPEAFVWNGRTDSGTVAPDGQYAYILRCTDEAGNTGSSAPVQVSLNTEKADLILQSSATAFSPNGDGVQDGVRFVPVMKAETPVESWQLEIRNGTGRIVRTFAGEGTVPESFVWDGTADGEEGSVCPDGTYTASLSVTLINQQTSRSAAPAVTLDSVYPELELAADWLLFSPNEQSIRRDLPVRQHSSAERLWTAEIRNADGEAVRHFSWQGEAPDFAWDAADDSGNRVPDGVYSYTVAAEDDAGNRTEKTIAGITVDSRIPKIYLTAEQPAFSPNGDTVLDTQTFTIGANIRENIASWEISIVAEDGDGESAARSWSSAQHGALPEQLEWDGKDNAGTVLQGNFRAMISVSYEKGESAAAITPAFLVNATPPELSVDLSPRFFSPDNDGIDDELYIRLSARSLSPFARWSFEIREPEGTAGRVFWQTGGSGTITEQIIWDGRSNESELVQAATDYPFTFTVQDDVGMTSVVRGYIPVDVLVIRDGNNLKIAVPSIIFAKNVATFDGLAPDVIAKNEQILRRVAEILNRFKTYNVVIEGHANNVTGTEREDREELIPLSQARSDAIRRILEEYGVSSPRLSTVGMGGTRPVAAREDRDNWWKNRRVEFILIK
ncbi:MAG: gliding motility-associated C-terminal domain-containing protein [Spirochaetes bacterium]|uniref:Gliding motility-associated C-terminal domain-containing protein n=1 Tax=Candidatus Avitreponema avistercoris TaxID=2840705 RepID=A0A9D9HDV0_9SPIR|nr:gliding motility-associated C-terminal domain-containing protein [Candidatus Avitreponema avistercoris]